MDAEQPVSPSTDDNCKVNMNMNKNHFVQQVQLIQYKVNSLGEEQRKKSFTPFQSMEKNMYGLALIDTGNMVHSALVSVERKLIPQTPV